MQKHLVDCHLTPLALAVGSQAAYTLLYVFEQSRISQISHGKRGILGVSLSSLPAATTTPSLKTPFPELLRLVAVSRMVVSDSQLLQERFSLSILHKEQKVSPPRVRHGRSWRSAALKCGT